MQNIAIENLFFIDIETVSCCEKYELLSEEWKELWTEKIYKALPDNTTPEQYYPRRAGIMAEFAKVVCISIGYIKAENGKMRMRIKSFCAEDERMILENFIQTVCQMQEKNTWNFAGHNIKEFDIPFLCRRILINDISIPECFNFQAMKPWDVPVIDTLHLWRFGDYKHYTSLKLLAATLGVPSPKDDIDGSKVGEVYWNEKNLQRIATYCQKDIATVANIVLRFKNMPLLTEEQIDVVL